MKTEACVVENLKQGESLPESEQRYRRLLAAITDYIYTVKVENGRSGATSHGPGCEAVTGYTSGEFAKDPYLWYSVVHEDDRERVVAQAARILKGEVPPPMEHRILHKQGGVRWVRNTTIPHTDQQGRLIAYDGLISDITNRKLAENKLAEEHNLLRTLVDNLPDCVFVKDTASRFLMSNTAQLRILGAPTAEEVVGKTDYDFFPQQMAARYRSEEETALRTTRPIINQEEPVVESTGRQRWFLCSKIPLKNDDGKVVGLVGIGRDITERRNSQQALRESEERLALVIQASNDGIWDWNMLTNEMYFSPHWKEMLGYTDAEIENQFSAWERLIHPEDLPRVRHCLQDYLSSAKVPTCKLEHRLLHRDGSYRWMLARGVALRDAQGKAIRLTGSHMDLTELKHTAEQLERAYAKLAKRDQILKTMVRKAQASHHELKQTQLQLIQAAKFESVGTLSAGVAHEVKNPLQTIVMGLDHLAHKLPKPDEELALTLADMRTAAKRATAIIHELLTFSSASDFQPVPGDMNALVESTLRLSRTTFLDAKISVVRDLAPGLPPVMMDAAKLEQVLINLFLNAIQAMPAGGTLVVRTRLLRLDSTARILEPILHKFKAGETLIVVEIQDTGSGIPDAYLSRVFDPFFTTKPVGLGTGLGLSVARKIVDLHGGAIGLKNVQTGGVLATVALKV